MSITQDFIDSINTSINISTLTYIPIPNFLNYEIATEYPYYVRNTRTNKIIKETKRDDGYCLALSCDNSNKKRQIYKHKLVAEMFIPNDDPINKKYVIRINGDKYDFRIENLMWLNSSKVPYQLADKLRNNLNNK